mgnify:CR=1 FL=1
MPSDTVLYAVGAGLFLLVLILVLVLVMRSRRQGEAPPPSPDVSWGDPTEPRPEPGASDAAAFPEPAPESLSPPATPAQVHYCRCPACQTQFTVNGTKPIVTNCPGCGKKGYLR